MWEEWEGFLQPICFKAWKSVPDLYFLMLCTLLFIKQLFKLWTCMFLCFPLPFLPRIFLLKTNTSVLHLLFVWDIKFISLFLIVLMICLVTPAAFITLICTIQSQYKMNPWPGHGHLSGSQVWWPPHYSRFLGCMVIAHISIEKSAHSRFPGTHFRWDWPGQLTFRKCYLMGKWRICLLSQQASVQSTALLWLPEFDTGFCDNDCLTSGEFFGAGWVNNLCASCYMAKKTVPRN